ncbi:hypothetical protein [Enterococcus sp. N249-2]
MKKKYKILGFLLLVLVGFIGSYFLQRDPSEDFYGDWYGVDTEGGGEFLFRIDKDKIIDYGNDDSNSPSIRYTLKKSENGFYLEVSDEELKNAFPELEDSDYSSNMTFFLNDDKESIEYFVAMSGFLNSVKLYKTSFDDSNYKAEELTSDSLLSSVSETLYSSTLSDAYSSETTSSIESTNELNLSDKIDSFIANYTAIPPEWIMEEEIGGITIRTTGNAKNETEASSILSNLVGISRTIANDIGENVELRLLEQDNHNYSVILVDGEIISSNGVFSQLN